MNKHRIGFVRECEIPIFYGEYHVGTRRVDFLVEGKISVELKAVTQLDDVHLAQALNYLEAFNLEIGLLINLFKRLLNRKYLPEFPWYPIVVILSIP